ncbi:MAG TPA: hypothetical protein DIC35_02340 [Candidatus Moranbacteria bacterium]|nr:hypothetical protein [Candidatus Moranbacteria bacterium]
MISTIRAMRSTFNLLLSIVQLFIGLAFAVKIFGSDLSSGGSLAEYVSDILEPMGEGAAVFVSSMDIAGPLAFLILILGFMLFSLALFMSVPSILRQARRNAEMEGRYD